jgi:phosphinothricin acetyltransferase
MQSSPMEPAGRGGVGLEVRRALDGDAEAIRSIYNTEVTGSRVTFDLVPRSVVEHWAWMAVHRGAYPVIVAVDEGGVVAGFASLSPYRPRPGYSTSVEDSVYVSEQRRGLGVGGLLLGEIVEMAAAHGFHSIIARIVADHEASIALHRSCGFELVGIEKEIGRKHGKWLSVAIMQRMLAEP